MKNDSADIGSPSVRSLVDGVEVCAWHGLRYAHAPWRFAPAQPASGRFAAAQLADVPVFPQLPGRLGAVMGEGSGNPQAEDAFFLNVWAPAQAQGLPVVLFIHGGAWMTGGGSMAWYDGSRLAAQGLVVVNVNYRLGPLGHLGDPQVHGLPVPAADLLLALQWVKERAADFGADPDRVSVMGQSAGGWYAHLLSVLEQTRGWIDRVVLLSMGTRTPWSGQQQIEVTRRAARNVRGDLLTADVDEVLRAGMAALDRDKPRLGVAPSAFLPVAGADVPAGLLDPAWAARACHAKAVYLQCTADESAAFFFDAPMQRHATQGQVDEALSQWSSADLPPGLLAGDAFRGAASGLTPYRQLVAASSWRQFQRFPRQYATLLQAAGRPSSYRCFGVESAQPGLHSAHCFDLPFLFGNLHAWKDAPMLQGFDQERFEEIAQVLRRDITTFVRE